MKKLIPAFLAGAIALTGVEVLANNVIESAEFGNTKIEFNEWPLELDRNIINVQLGNSADTHRFISLKSLLTAFGHGIDWNAQTNTLEIINFAVHHYRELRELHPIIEPIDMDSINPDEWFNWWQISSNNKSLSIHSGVLVSLMENAPRPDNEHLMSSDDWEYWFENHFDRYFDRTIFTSVIGCNVQEIRTIMYESHSGFSEIQINLQDIKDSGIFSDEEIEQLLENIHAESSRDSWEPEILTEEEIRRRSLDNLLLNISDPSLFGHNIHSNEQLEQLAEIVRLEMSNK